MPDLPPLLHSLIDSPKPPAEDRRDFKKTLALLNLHSVFDIIRLSRTDFIEQVARHCDDDAGQAYDNACGYAAQLEFQHRHEASPNAEMSRSKRNLSRETPAGPTYSALFGEDWSAYCDASSIAALDSPAAYLRALYLFAQQVETTGKGTGKRITLATRRPTLKDMPIDDQSLNRKLPLLTIVNEVLSGHLGIHLNRHPDKYKFKSVNDALEKTRYPFELPFDLAHQQALLGLTGNKPALGELNYRLSLTLPLGHTATNNYGVIDQQASVAQQLLSGLSPEQQVLLTEPLWTDSKSPFTEHYGSNETALKKLDHFMRQTGLTSTQVDKLLARGTYQARPSKNVQPALIDAHQTHLSGVCYINGLEGGSTQRLDLKAHGNGQVELLNTSAERFDRLQRMIRLQRWVNVPFAQLDTLMFSARQCEANTETPFEINDNTLRVLGVYRYLNRRYGLQADELSALLYQIPVHAVGNSDSLFDRIFNSGHLNGQSLQLDDTPLNPYATDIATQSALYQICAALGLGNTAESLGYVAERTRDINKYLNKDLRTLSALYRQARIASLFGLTITECAQLADLLSAANTSEQWVKPCLRSSSNQNSPADFLDALMQMEWAVNWLKSNNCSVQQLRHQLMIGNSPQSAVVTEQLKQLKALYDDFHNRFIPQSSIDELSLPELASNEASGSTPWRRWIAIALMKALSKPKQQLGLDAIRKILSEVISEQVPQQDASSNDRRLKREALEKIRSILHVAYEHLKPVREHIKRLFCDSSHVWDMDHLQKHRFMHVANQLAQSVDHTTAFEELKYMLLMLPDADKSLQLPLTREVLHKFLLHPHWLDSRALPDSQLKLTLNTLYLFQQFNHCISTYGVSQDVLLNYFEISNPSAVEVGDERNLTLRCNTLLGAILNWDVSEVEGLVDRLQTKRVRSMQELEWLMRGHDTAKVTGLSSRVLIKATHLTSKIAGPDWELVGKAVIAAQRP